jgi:hypothetical protein
VRIPFACLHEATAGSQRQLERLRSHRSSFSRKCFTLRRKGADTLAIAWSTLLGNAKESEVKKNESGVKNRGAASPLTTVLAFHTESLLPSFASPLRLRALR